MPGTFGSLAGLLIFYLVRANTWLHVLLTFVLLIAGFLFAGKAERVLNRKDSPRIVIDEVVGMLISLLFLPYGLKIAISGFVLFRILDTLKPFPAGLLQDLKGSKGVMADDIIAGLYTNVILQIVVRLASCKVS